MDQKEFRDSVLDILENNILSYWLTLRDPRGGFYGEVDGLGRIDPDAPRGVILNARIIWAFSAAWRVLKRPGYLDAATHAFRWFQSHFADPGNGGVFWSVSADGKPLDAKKQLYAQGFAIYGLSEYVAATGSREALDTAVQLFHTVERHFKDTESGGYIEALGRDFSPLEDMSLSASDINCDKTMNSHLHILEAFASLYRVWPDPGLKQAVEDLLDIVCGKIMGPDGHLRLYFDRKWNVLPGGTSWGHDIETSWLALECAQALGDPAVVEKVMPAARKMGAAGNAGLAEDDGTEQWWAYAEAVVGNLWLWKYHGEAAALERAEKTYDFIRTRLVDRERGEWYWALLPNGEPDLGSPKAGFWKCPYHNSRMCLRVLLDYCQSEH